MKRQSIVILIVLVSCGIIPGICENSFANPPGTLTATFDDLSEGYWASSFTDGGITISDLSWYTDDIGLVPGFVVEGVGAQYNLGSAFTRPNGLSSCGHSPGDGYGYSRFGSAKITCGMKATAGGIDIFTYPRDYETNILKLQAIANGTVVASSTIRFNDGLGYHRLAVSGTTFDYMQMVASGANNQGTVFILMDNITMTPIPEPASALLIGAGFLFARLRCRHS
jgi:hypothetical protein